ncbi:MAG: hypothetical protein GY859_18415 [Desulfobacterales bacterium]|nr:hypothetical protein [Desulfobacterales bacterium]
MKRFFQLFTVLFSIMIASTAMGADEIPFTPIDTEPVLLATTYSLDISSSQGLGTVISNPEGINCTIDGTSTSGDCQEDFPENTVVALQATATQPESGSSHFCGWNEDYSNSIPVFAVLMDGDKAVSAQFCALGDPIALIPVPSSNEIYGPYLPVSEPVLAGYPSDMKPIAVAERTDGGYDLNVELLPFGDFQRAGGVDVYAALSVDGVPDLFLFNSTGALVSISGGLVAWKTNATGAGIEETLVEIPGALLPFLPSGLYHVHLMVTPTGSTSHYYYWTTYFEKLDFMINPFLLTP